MLIKYLKKVEKFKCGINHSIVLDKNGILWGWGSGTHGELGNSELKDFYYPTKMNIFDVKGKIKKICLGAAHTLILNEQGKLYGCGDN